MYSNSPSCFDRNIEFNIEPFAFILPFIKLLKYEVARIDQSLKELHVIEIILNLYAYYLDVKNAYIRYELMGNTLNCFKTSTKSPFKQPIQNQETHSIIDIKIWKEVMGYMNQNQEIVFDYPSNVEHKTFKQIRKDITRTFPESTFFLNNPENQEIFYKLLCKVAVYLPRVGYTQGMNFFAGFFLLSGFSEKEALTMCTKVLINSDLLLIGLYEDEFPLNRLYCALFWEVLDLNHKNLKAKLKSFQIVDELWIFQWFMTFFIYSFPLEIIPEIWTFVFLRKEFSFVRIAFAIVVELEQKIMKCESELDFFELLENLKKIEFFTKTIRIQNVVERADKISNEKIKEQIQNIDQDLQRKIKYCEYFRLPENDKKIKYVEIFGKFAEDRQLFLKNPEGFEFTRDENEISALDSIEMKQARLLYNSLKVEINPAVISSGLNSSKLWKSDLHKFKSVEPHVTNELEEIREEKSKFSEESKMHINILNQPQ